jgi:hypothetical protein
MDQRLRDLFDGAEHVGDIHLMLVIIGSEFPVEAAYTIRMIRNKDSEDEHDELVTTRRRLNSAVASILDKMGDEKIIHPVDGLPDDEELQAQVASGLAGTAAIRLNVYTNDTNDDEHGQGHAALVKLHIGWNEDQPPSRIAHDILTTASDEFNKDSTLHAEGSVSLTGDTAEAMEKLLDIKTKLAKTPGAIEPPSNLDVVKAGTQLGDPREWAGRPLTWFKNKHVKCVFHNKDGQGERLWVRITGHNEKSELTGTIANDPVVIPLKNGDPIVVEVEEIIDVLY